MNGAEHYAEAERLLDEVQSKGMDLIAKTAGMSSTTSAAAAAVIQATATIALGHAELATAAATIDAAAARGPGDVDPSWNNARGVKPQPVDDLFGAPWRTR